MVHPAVWYALGLGSAVLAAPATKRLRPVAVTAAKGIIVASREVQRVAEEARAQLDDITAEARAAVDAQPAGGETAGS